ncbi:heterokaryon incompatibility protein-domain-containing protein [Dactylonectria macrodidyma]|uniref:Heterokaryon incompatibility protein-domain-containing protein n=1 Tax=Dactylonectria macrodidyma TaxID=307937 RepID=A0A9P9DYS9_9HYPO|nr:heterokaryon incompatibility protein-domain-containing protein [Dactylonectria macrodidyma]
MKRLTRIFSRRKKQGQDASIEHQANAQPLATDANDHAPLSGQLPSQAATAPQTEVGKPMFQYVPLKATSNFRILCLQRKLSETNTLYEDLPLRGTIIEASLDNHPEYFALSYTWGDPDLCEEIDIDGKALKITANCASALRRMMRGKASRTIWVDSICINQANTPEAVTERNTQVAMMDEIYRHAVQVNVHLGNGDQASDVACEALKSLAQAYLAAKMAPPHQREALQRKYDELADDVLMTTTEYPYGKLHGVFRLPWFRRTWVVQEVALAQKVIFYCGKHLMHIKTIVVGADFTRLPYSNLDANTSGRYWRIHLEYHDSMGEFIRRREQGEPTTNFGINLTKVLMLPVFSLEATRPEDKIFGLYGICKRLGFEIPAPDYRKPLAVVYTETARAMLRGDQSLNLLSMVQESPGWARGLPSWVPDFSESTRKWSLSNPPHMFLSKRENRNVSGQTQSEYHFEPDGRGLKVKGRRLSPISVVGQPWIVDSSTNILGDAQAQTGQYTAGLIDCLRSWFDVVRSQPECVRDSAAMETLVRVLAEEACTPYSTEPMESLVRHLSVLVAISRSRDKALHTILADPQDNPGGFSDVGNFTVSAEMQRAILHISDLTWKAVFRTAHNHLGTGTHSARTGDVVVVLHGCTTAAIVRPWRGGFKYISPAHVQGIMDGEFWNSGSASDDEWFVLI